jgi:hypothetical protein
LNDANELSKEEHNGELMHLLEGENDRSLIGKVNSPGNNEIGIKDLNALQIMKAIEKLGGGST